MTSEEREKVLEDLKKKNPNIKIYESNYDLGEGVVFFRRMLKIEYKQLQGELQDSVKREHAPLNICKRCVLYPSNEELVKVLDDFPGYPRRLFNEILDASGVGEPSGKVA